MHQKILNVEDFKNLELVYIHEGFAKWWKKINCFVRFTKSRVLKFLRSSAIFLQKVNGLNPRKGGIKVPIEK